MKRLYIMSSMVLLGLLAACGGKEEGGGDPPIPPVVGEGDVKALTDGKLDVAYEAEGANISFIVEVDGTLGAYSLYAADAHDANADPKSWTLSGSNDKAAWIKIDEQKEVTFSARFQERNFALSQPGSYKYLKFEVQPNNGNKLSIAEAKWFTEDPNKQWKNFPYPAIVYTNTDAGSNGSKYYDYLVGNKEEYLKYHTREVAKLLYWTDDDMRKDIKQINYVLKSWNGVSAKSGNPPVVTIEYSTNHIAAKYGASMLPLDFETRGVLYHEMVHCYQYEPKGIPPYQEPNTAWACIEGLADAVRAHAGYISKAERKPGGWYSDGYKTTGFFLEWLTTKDPDALRKFNLSAKELPVWSFDGAMEFIFKKPVTASALWNEYQDFLKSGK